MRQRDSIKHSSVILERQYLLGQEDAKLYCVPLLIEFKLKHMSPLCYFFFLFWKGMREYPICIEAMQYNRICPVVQGWSLEFIHTTITGFYNNKAGHLISNSSNLIIRNGNNDTDSEQEIMNLLG